MKLKFYIKLVIFSILILGVIFFIWKVFFEEKRQLEIQKSVVVNLSVDGLNYQTTTEASNVNDFLKEKGFENYSKDFIVPGLNWPISPYSNVSMVSLKELSIKVDEEEREVETTRRTIEKLLQDEKIKLNPFDIVEPGLNELVQDKEEIVITRIEKKNIVEEEAIEYETIIEGDKKLTWKKQKTKQEGKDGLKEVEYELVYKNGELISKTKLATKILKEAQSEIIVEGRKIEIESTQKGLASWYSWSGQMKCASVRYPRGTWLRVTSKDNGKQIIVQVNDYGPDPGTGRVIDLDKVAFEKLMSPGAGVINVKIEEIRSD